MQTPACLLLLLFCLSNFKDSCRTAEECCLETFCENTFHFALLLCILSSCLLRVLAPIPLAKKQNANLKSFRHRPQLGHPLRQYTVGKTLKNVQRGSSEARTELDLVKSPGFATRGQQLSMKWGCKILKFSMLILPTVQLL